MSLLAIVLIVVAVAVCCGLCGYAIAAAVRRSRGRREQAARAPTVQ